jgi:hypothetical protein
VKKTIRVIQEVEVEIDETQFDRYFRNQYLQYHGDLISIDDHLLNLSEQFATGKINNDSEFLIGYGILKKRGIKFKLLDKKISFKL